MQHRLCYHLINNELALEEFINKSLLIIEDTRLGKFIDNDVLDAIDVINSLSNLEITK